MYICMYVYMYMRLYIHVCMRVCIGAYACMRSSSNSSSSSSSATESLQLVFPWTLAPKPVMHANSPETGDWKMMLVALRVRGAGS